MYKINTGIIKEIVDGKTIIFNPENSYLIELNETGLLIFNLIYKKKTLKQILVKLQKLFPKIPKHQLKIDLKNFIDALKKYKIIYETK